MAVIHRGRGCPLVDPASGNNQRALAKFSLLATNLADRGKFTAPDKV